jgi:DNA-binding transcriptional regulator YiaG
MRRSKIEKELAAKMVEDIMDFIDMSQKEYDGPSKIAALEFKRDQLKLSRVEFAKVLGVSRQVYDKFLHGKQNLTPYVLERAYTLGVPPSSLMRSLKTMEANR